MTTPKPKARKAACVWVVEWCGVPDFTSLLRRDCIVYKRTYPGRHMRIRKYQRIDK